MRSPLIVALLLLSSQAQASGSSVVRAQSSFFAVEIESVRKIFERGDGEAEWHDAWKKRNRPIANRLKTKIEADIAPLVETYALLPFRAELPVVLDDNPDTDEAIEALRSKKPFELRFRFEDVSVSVIVAKLPARNARRALRKAFAAYLPSR